MAFKPLVNISQVNAGATVTIEVPVGSTYHQIQLLTANLTPAQVTNIQLYADTKLFQEYTDLAQLNAINAFYKRPQNGNYFTFWFDRPELQEDFREITAIGTKDLKAFTIKFKIDAAAVSPGITARAETSLNLPLGLITKVKQQTYPLTSSGLQDITKVPQIGKIMGLHFYKVVDDMTELNFKRDSVELIDTDVTDLEEFQLQYDRVPQANFVHYDFAMKGNLFNALEVQEYASVNGQEPEKVQDVRAKVNITTAGDVLLISEHIDSLSGA